MSAMTAASFSGRAIDLSGLKAAAQTPPPPPGASFVVDVDERSFEAVMAKSMQHPVVLELTSPRAHGADQLSKDLAELANEAGGKYLLARVDVDVAKQIPAALGIQAVPMVIGVVAGQLAPLFQGTRSKEEAAAVIAQLLQAAASNGVLGRAEPIVDPAAEPVADPRFDAADAALESGDYAKAREEFEKILAQTPNDAEATAGRAQAGLLDRLSRHDATLVMAKAATAPDDAAAQQDAADIELASGRPEAAFARLIEAIRATSGEERNALRLRLLELFETLGGTHPAVLKARRDLTSALF